MQLEILRCLGYGPKALMYKATTMYSLKSMLFSQLTMLSNNLILVLYLNGVYLESCFYWLWVGVQKTLKKSEKKKKINK